MNHSSSTSLKALRNANYFLTVLSLFSLSTLIIALWITHADLLTGFHHTHWFTNTLLNSIFFYSALCSAIFIYAYIYCWYRNNGWGFLAAGILLSILLATAKIIHLVSLTNLTNAAGLVIWSCCLLSLLWRLLTDSVNRALNLNLLLTLILPVLFILLATFFLGLTIVFHPKTQDELLMAIDATLSIHPSFLAGQLFAYLPRFIFLLLRFIYLTLPCALAVIYIARYQKDQRPPLEFIIEFFLLGIGGMLLYHINTGCGPINAFKGAWPQQLPVIPLHPVAQLCIGTFLPRNCLPSLHTAWAICIWRHSLRCHRKIRFLITGWVICTLASTLGLGEHYLVDLIVGFTFANMIGGVCAIDIPLKQTARKNAIIFGGLLGISWYLLINFGLPLLRLSPLLAWFCYITSIFLSAKLELNLMRAQKLINGFKIS